MALTNPSKKFDILGKLFWKSHFGKGFVEDGVLKFYAEFLKNTCEAVLLNI